MKKKFLVLALTAFMCSHSYAQDSNTKEIDDKYVENDVVSLAGKKGFSFSTKAGDFLFKPACLSTDTTIKVWKASMHATGQTVVLLFLMPSLDLQAKHLEKSHSTYH